MMLLASFIKKKKYGLFFIKHCRQFTDLEYYLQSISERKYNFIHFRRLSNWNAYMRPYSGSIEIVCYSCLCCTRKKAKKKKVINLHMILLCSYDFSPKIF